MEAILFRPSQGGAVGRVRGEVAPFDRQPPKPRASDPSKVARAGEHRLISELLGHRPGIGRVHEDVLEDGGGVVAREVVKDRLRELSADGEEASPCALVALPGPNRGEVLARRGPKQQEALFVWVRLSDGRRDLLRVVLGDVAPMGEPWQLRGRDLEAVLVDLPRQRKAWLSKALLDEVGSRPYPIARPMGFASRAGCSLPCEPLALLGGRSGPPPGCSASGEGPRCPWRFWPFPGRSSFLALLQDHCLPEPWFWLQLDWFQDQSPQSSWESCPALIAAVAFFGLAGFPFALAFAAAAALGLLGVLGLRPLAWVAGVAARVGRLLWLLPLLWGGHRQRLL